MKEVIGPGPRAVTAAVTRTGRVLRCAVSDAVRHGGLDFDAHVRGDRGIAHARAGRRGRAARGGGAALLHRRGRRRARRHGCRRGSPVGRAGARGGVARARAGARRGAGAGGRRGARLGGRCRDEPGAGRGHRGRGGLDAVAARLPRHRAHPGRRAELDAAPGRRRGAGPAHPADRPGARRGRGAGAGVGGDGGAGRRGRRRGGRVGAAARRRTHPRAGPDETAGAGRRRPRRPPRRRGGRDRRVGRWTPRAGRVWRRSASAGRRGSATDASPDRAVRPGRRAAGSPSSVPGRRRTAPRTRPPGRTPRPAARPGS